MDPSIPPEGTEPRKRPWERRWNQATMPTHEKRKVGRPWKRTRGPTATEKLEREVKQLEEEWKAFRPERGSDPRTEGGERGGGKQTPRYHTKRFDALPMSVATKDALKEEGYVDMTEVQRACLPHALCGRDVMGAARTGSGKTLAFLLPVLECLFRNRWTTDDGVGAIVISPTRELAIQIFQVLAKVGKKHSFSAALLIGGKNVEQEQEKVHYMNILVCTPGRLLQHMDETPSFHCDNLLMLVLDEADRCLDMGFQRALNAIVQFLPKERQTLLFSATQTKSVQDLARLSLKDPEYLSVHAESSTATPKNLQQTYIECQLHHKVQMLWSFLKTHLTHKTVIFVSSCKQAKFLHEAFRKLRPGVPLRCLHGKMKQQKRLIVFQEFCQANSMAMFATDVAARGLDFPAVDWVLQVDCPESIGTYIHRVGRTARYTSKGKALLLLLPSERAFLDKLKDAKVPLRKLQVNPNKQQAITPALQALLSKEPQLRIDAQKALVSYLKSVFMNPDKEVFNIHMLPVADFADSLGLPNPPKLQFLKGKKAKALAREAAKAMAPASAAPLGGAENFSRASEETDVHTKVRQARGMKNRVRSPPGTLGDTDVGEHQTTAMTGGLFSHTDDENDDEDFLVVKNRYEPESELAEDGVMDAEPLESAKAKKKRMKIRPNKPSGEGKRVLFDAEGNPVDPLAALGKPADEGETFDAEKHFEAARRLLRERNAEDRKLQRERLAAVRQAKKRRRREAEGGGMEESPSDTEEDEPCTSAKEYPSPAPRLEVAHEGMLPRKKEDIASMSLREQEELALHLLRRSG